MEEDIKTKIKNEEIVAEVIEDFNCRKQDKMAHELAFELNMNFVAGNQNYYISGNGELLQTQKNYPFEKKEVFNHCAPIVETRLAKLARVRPGFSVRPASASEQDIACAKLSKNILDAFSAQKNLSDIVAEATVWSEICGTSFYKIIWDSDQGDLIGKDIDGKDIHFGDVNISVCSPFEIFPDSIGSKDLSACMSLIYAKAYPVGVIKDVYGVDVLGEDVDVFTLDNFSRSNFFAGNSNYNKLKKHTKKDHAIVIEKYIRPSAEYPNGRLIIVAGNKLVFDGELPYACGEKSERDFPFVRQVCVQGLGSFFGTSIVDRCIPIQRAYNAIKNRKHEFIGRLTSGVLAVEDGSVDIDNLEEEGLAPGKILVYRAGSSAPEYLDVGSVPAEFSKEEDRLLNEFISVSGVSELMRGSNVPSGVSSGTALELLIEQDDTRLSITAENIRSAVREIARMVLRLYKQFASVDRVSKTIDEDGEIEMLYWSSSDLSSDDVVLDTSNEMTETPAQRKSSVLDLLSRGLLHDENGKLSSRMKARVLDLLGFGNWESSLDIINFQVKRACKENLKLIELASPEVYDDHSIHIDEHTKFLLSSENKNVDRKHIEKLKGHLMMHKQLLGGTKLNVDVE